MSLGKATDDQVVPSLPGYISQLISFGYFLLFLSSTPAAVECCARPVGRPTALHSGRIVANERGERPPRPQWTAIFDILKDSASFI